MPTHMRNFICIEGATRKKVAIDGVEFVTSEFKRHDSCVISFHGWCSIKQTLGSSTGPTSFRLESCLSEKRRGVANVKRGVRGREINTSGFSAADFFQSHFVLPTGGGGKTKERCNKFFNLHFSLREIFLSFLFLSVVVGGSRVSFICILCPCWREQ